MKQWSAYHTPSTLEAAIQLLGQHPDSALVAGGTDLLLDLTQGRHPPINALIDISRIPELQTVEVQDGYLTIGAALPLARLIQDDRVQQHAPGLVEACKLIGGPQVRNVATLGGNVAHALPAGDGTIALLSLGAEAWLAGQNGRRWVPTIELFAGPGEVVFDRGEELLVALRIRLKQVREGSAFRRVMRPQGVAIAILNTGVWLRCRSDGVIEDARIAMGPGGPTPFLATSASKALIGHQPDDSAIAVAAKEVQAEARFRTSKHRSTKAYREHLVRPLLQRTVTAAYQRALDESW
jgi:carbon-monoxide dehydrogenase medium subunit